MLHITRALWHFVKIRLNFHSACIFWITYPQSIADLYIASPAP